MSLAYPYSSEEKFFNEFLSTFQYPAMTLSDHYQVIHCNEIFLEFYELPRSQLIGHNLLEIGRSNHGVPIFRELKSILEKKREHIIVNTVNNGQTRAVQWMTSPICQHEAFNCRFFLFGIDVTHLLSQSTQEQHINRSIIDYLQSHYVFWKDRNSVYLGCNQAMASAFGLKSCDEIKGKTDYDLPTSKEQSDAYRADDQLVIETGKPKLNIEEYQTLADGKTRVLLTSKMPLFDDQGQIDGVLAIYSDITERKNLELSLEHAKNLAESANVAKSEFLANMRHDIRTPLTGIVGFAELIKAESSDSKIQKYAEGLMQSSHALLELMDEVLDSVKVGSGEMPILKIKFNIINTLEKIIALYQARAMEKKLSLNISIDKKLPPFVVGDKIRLHRILLELLGNALNFTNKGRVDLSIDVLKHNFPEFMIKISVSDTGIGIPKEKQKDIYAQFKRLTPSFEGVYKGVGLGLYVVKQFVEQLGGEIYVDSDLNKGTCFTCLIPMVEFITDNPESNEKEEATIKQINDIRQNVTTNHESSYDGLRLLLVEDNEVAQYVTQLILTGLSCQVDIAANGIEAIALCKKNYYDLIFMDIGLGEGMDGYEITHYIRTKSNKSKKTPIIALTAHVGNDNKQRCIDIGMNEMLTKPLTQACAIDMLNTFVIAKRSMQEGNQMQECLVADSQLFHIEQYEIFNRDEALRHCGNKEEILIEMLTLMVNQQVPSDLEQMKNAFLHKDYQLVANIAHKIKGGAMYLGTIRINYACQYVENYWKSGKRELFEQLYNQAVRTIELSLMKIKNWLKQRSLLP